MQMSAPAPTENSSLLNKNGAELGSPSSKNAERLHKWQRLTFFITFVAYACSHLTRKAYSTVKRSMKTEDGIDETVLSEMDTTFMFAYAGGSIVSGALGDRLRPPTIVGVGIPLRIAISFIRFHTTYVLQLHSRPFAHAFVLLAGWTDRFGRVRLLFGVASWHGDLSHVTHPRPRSLHRHVVCARSLPVHRYVFNLFSLDITSFTCSLSSTNSFPYPLDFLRTTPDRRTREHGNSRQLHPQGRLPGYLLRNFSLLFHRVVLRFH